MTYRFRDPFSTQGRKEIEAKILKDAKSAKKVIQEEVYNKTMKEVALKQMGPPRTVQYFDNKFGTKWNCVQRYGIEQGSDDSGKTKYRCIDNHADNDNNAAAGRRQQVPMTSVAQIMLIVRTMYMEVAGRGPDWDLRGGHRRP